MKKCCRNCKQSLKYVSYLGGCCHLYTLEMGDKTMEHVYCDHYEQKKDRFELAAEALFMLENFTRDKVREILKRYFGEQE